MNSKIENYDPQKLEKNIQNYWKEKELYRANFNGKDGKKKYNATLAIWQTAYGPRSELYNK